MAAAPRIEAIELRQARLEDVPALVALNRAAYPDLVAADVVYNAGQLNLHLSRFAEGQIVVERDGELVGALSTFVVPPESDACAQHTWLDITDHGTFARHDARGHTLYLADIYTHPTMWGRGLAQALYRALFALAARGSRRGASSPAGASSATSSTPKRCHPRSTSRAC
jgi:GNAT superfamily N-acetyltransferase